MVADLVRLATLSIDSVGVYLADVVDMDSIVEQRRDFQGKHC